jgi:uncharacterized caspase-like protein
MPRRNILPATKGTRPPAGDTSHSLTDIMLDSFLAAADGGTPVKRPAAHARGVRVELMRNSKGFCLLLALLLLVLLSAAPSFARQERGISVGRSTPERRFALVIGNGAYGIGPLKNPTNDARDMAQTLSALGFELIHKENLNQIEMKRAIREFGAKIRGGGVGLFYYAGHGVQVKGVNYLVPVDAKIESEEEVEYECVDAGFVLAQMESAGNSMNILILDACRNNPFARSFRSASRGLAQMDAPSGTLIAYATAPGFVASDGSEQNGLYTQELLKFMRTQDLSLEEVFKRVRVSVRNLTQGKQTPWESSSFTGSFYFNRGGEPPPTARVQPPAAIDSIMVELAFWDTIKNSTNPEDYDAYLKRYPNGEFAALARRRRQANAKAAPPASTPSRVAPPTETSSEAEVEQVVASLKTLGTARIDLGKFGEDLTTTQVLGPCRIKFEERVLWNSKARFKPTIAETTVVLTDVNIASIGVTEVKPPDRPVTWAVTVRSIQGRAFLTSMTGYENRSLEKVKVPTKTDNYTAAVVAIFMDSEAANLYAKTLAKAARLCGAKTETF